jgi:CheY-like chemotaxis protein/HPt (histidine-containing phosphotransfer) domain-containing protein
MRLRQVLTNLVANAIKFTEQGEVEVSIEPFAAPGGGPGAVITVRDTGIGIEPDVLPFVFDAFMQASAGMSRRYGGTGLGLTIARQLIGLMGGSISVDSRIGVGSEFRIELGLQPPVVEPDLREAGELPTMRVLVVDDHAGSRTVLAELLAGWGIETTVANDGRDALDLLRAQAGGATPFDVALVDMHMPNLDGMGLARVLQSTGSHPDLKLILLSSMSTPDDMQAAHDAGFGRVVAKPVRKSELRQALLGISASPTESPRLTPALNAHILVVEDNAVNQEVIGQMLRSLGCRVQVSSGGLAGLRALCDKHFDMVLMDIQMPGMDGVEALNRFRQPKTGRYSFLTPTDTPVIAVTANALEGDEKRFLGLGFDGYLSKPFRQSQLLAMLTQHLQLSAPADTRQSGAGGPGAASTPSSGAAGGLDVLDAGALDRLRELDPHNENRLMERVVSAFETSVARLMPQLQDALEASELAGIRHVSHTLKSSSASIGAVKLSKMCSEIEAMARQNQSDGMTERVVLLQAEVEIVRVALQRMLNA